MTVPDEAVEAAAREVYHTSGRNRVMPYSQAKSDCEKEARRILTAAAPFLTARLEAEVAYQMARAAYFKYLPEIGEDSEGVAGLLTNLRKARDARNAI